MGTARDGGLGRGASACRSLGIDRSHRCLERTTKRGVSFEFEIGFGDAGMVGRTGERRGGCRGQVGRTREWGRISLKRRFEENAYSYQLASSSVNNGLGRNAAIIICLCAGDSSEREDKEG